MSGNLREIPVVSLCGGDGVFIDATGVRHSKGLVQVEGEAIIVHLLRHFARHGARRFLLCCGRAMEGYAETLEAFGERGGNEVQLSRGGLEGVAKLIDTGPVTPTAERVRKARPFLGNAPWFWVTYSDTLCPVDLQDLANFHLEQGRIATCLAARLPTRFRILGMRRGETLVRGFATRPVIQNDFINGGFYAFQAEIFGPAYLGDADHAVMEEVVLEALAAGDQLVAYPYEGPWQYLDSERDIQLLGRIVPLLKAEP
ncbi:MAG: hypothetical protein IPL96_14695 [Holophagaceae bacterium]|nr:hypothetical protein [Holophagaceae bacterium]